ncbi:MAG: hypothetical protein RI983_1168 [Bacteroidota bacterium]|jgi:hypothetical protein
MVKRTALVLLFVWAQISLWANTVSGVISVAANQTPLPFSSVLVKGTTRGASANSNGFYSLYLEPGKYTLVFQYIGYQSQEKNIVVTNEPLKLDVFMAVQSYQLNEVVVKTGGEDPAYAIIRNAIARRKENLNEIKQFSTEVYIKGQMQLRNYPKTFLGQKVDFEDGDTSKRKMLLLSETIAKYSVSEPNQRKVEVISTKLSGRSNGFGFSNPQIISFYENTISLGDGLNPRGFISPISDNALNFYRYKFEGTFYESGKEINRIRVIPRRNYEPLFTGFIHITENDWHIQSVDLKLLREQQMQLLDSLVIQQQYVPLQAYWVIKQQMIYPYGKFFGFDFFGSFLQVYNQFDIAPAFKPRFFNNVIRRYEDSANKKTMAYWDSIRPLPLLAEEIRDYQKKDSLEKVRESPAYLDSLDKIRNKLSVGDVLLTGKTFSKRKEKTTLRFDPLINSLNFNTVEGGVLLIAPQWRKQYEGRKALSITPEFRYGFANKHFNPSLSLNYSFGKKYFQSLQISGGKKVFQFNNAAPISESINTIYTLMREQNFMKIYEADFLRINYNSGIGNGLNFSGAVQFQNRRPLNNMPDIAFWKNFPDRTFTSNYPSEWGAGSMVSHRALLLSVGFSWIPGAKYIEYPDRKVNIGSGYPTFNLSVTKALPGMFGADADYTKWRLNISDEMNLGLAGELKYAFTTGGFLQRNKVYEPDQIHFLGNQVIFASTFTNSFQLAPYYRYSNTASLYGTAHLEYHLNGLLTNKIPGFKKLNWFLVTGANGLLIEKGNYYLEYFAGLENIFKVLRVDYIRSVEQGGAQRSGIRIALPLRR